MLGIRPLRQHLLWLVAAALLPMALLTAGLTTMLLSGERERGERTQLQTARAIFYAVEAEVDRTITALQTLALHDSLRRGDLESFRPVAQAAQAALGGWNNVLVLGPNAEHLVNLKRAPGQPLPKLLDADNVLETARTRKPVISHTIARGAATGEPFIAISVPVLIDGQAKYVLLATMTSAHWASWLAQRAPEGSPVAIIDRDFVIFARSKDNAQTAGKPVQPWYRDILMRQREGVVRGQGVVQSDVRPAFVRSERTGLTVNLVASGAVVDAPFRKAFAVLAAGSALILGLALMLALWRTRALTRGIAVMREASQGLRGDPPRVSPARTAILEINDALATAEGTAATLRERQGEIDRLQEALRARALAAEADVRRKDEFLATLAHELRNPLAPIVNALEVMRRSGDSAPTRERLRGIIDRQVRQMARLVDDLLDLSRINTGKIQLRLGSVEVAEIVRSAMEAVRPTFVAAEIRLQADVDAPGLCVRGDPVRLTQVLVNLLTNAAKFSPAGSTVRIELDSEDAQVRLRVRDQGIGLQAEDLERIFEMFSQVKSDSHAAQGGLGIGLALVRSLVLAHGGTVTANSEGVGRGSVFTVRLPLEPGATAPEPRVDVQTAPALRLRVLVADDNRDAVETLSLLLQMLEHEVHTAHDGQAALDLALALRPDVLLMDIGMPLLSGIEACRRIRATGVGAAMHIVAISGWGQPQDRERTAEAGFDAHLVKPIDLDALAQALTQAHDRRSASVGRRPLSASPTGDQTGPVYSPCAGPTG